MNVGDKMNYPKGTNMEKQNTTAKQIIYGNRGMNLENDLNITNEYYRDHDLALVYKKPTPIKISKVNYDTMKITEAFFESPSTTDYNGIYQGKYLDFEAKETNQKTAFPLKNIHKHQLKHMEAVLRQQGICFLIVRFNKRDETFLLFAKDLMDYIKEKDVSSIPHSYFEEKGFLIETKYHPRVDYLKIIKEHGGV